MFVNNIVSPFILLCSYLYICQMPFQNLQNICMFLLCHHMCLVLNMYHHQGNQTLFRIQKNKEVNTYSCKKYLDSYFEVYYLNNQHHVFQYHKSISQLMCCMSLHCYNLQDRSILKEN